MIMTLCDNSNDTIIMGGFTPEEDRNEQKHQHPWVWVKTKGTLVDT